MKKFKDYSGRTVRLSTERSKHILEHPEMKGMLSKIADTLTHPQKVIQSLSDSQARLYYRYYIGTIVGDKYLCVVVRFNVKDAFILTAYLTDTVKKGEIVWLRK